MESLLTKLRRIAGPPLNAGPPNLSRDLLDLAGSLGDELLTVLKEKNGFYAFESALHVFPAQSESGEIGLDHWNSETLWRNSYCGMTDGCLFFAEDVFGGQFCIKNSEVSVFDPETGGLENLAPNLEEWAKAILTNYEELTGYPLAHEWQELNGPLLPGMRLVPKIPFVMGGEFTLSNLYVLNSAESMLLRAAIATQIKNLPEGTPIKLDTSE